MQLLKANKKSFFLHIALSLLVCNILVKADEIRKITPPQLDSAHLGKRILCHRPMRRGSPHMTVESKENKVIVHNYGHGGSGWTLGPGSAHHVNNLLEQSFYSTDLTKNTPITIIGGGALGLFTAYDLVQRGYTALTIIAETFEDITSHNAGGLLAPVSMDNNPAMQALIDQIGIDAYNFYEAIAKEQNPDFPQGAVIVPTYFTNREESGLEPYVGKVMQPAKDVTLDFGNGTQHKMVVYDDGIFIDTATMMISLTNYLKSRVTFIQKRIDSWDQVATHYIINCSGLGSKELNHDDDMVSVQGHLIMLKDQKPTDLDYMLLVYFNEGKTKSGQKVKRSFYIFPKKLANTAINDVGVIGGTFIEGATNRTPNEKEFNILIQGAKEFYGLH